MKRKWTTAEALTVFVAVTVLLAWVVYRLGITVAADLAARGL